MTNSLYDILNIFRYGYLEELPLITHITCQDVVVGNRDIFELTIKTVVAG
jgi:hypothetical protein